MLAISHKVDEGTFITNNIFATYLIKQHKGKEGIGHRKQAATELGVDIVAIIKAKFYDQVYLLKIIADGHDFYAGAPVGWP